MNVLLLDYLRFGSGRIFCPGGRRCRRNLWTFMRSDFLNFNYIAGSNQLNKTG